MKTFNAFKIFPSNSLKDRDVYLLIGEALILTHELACAGQLCCEWLHNRFTLVVLYKCVTCSR